MFINIRTASGGAITLNTDQIASIRQTRSGGCNVTMATGQVHELDATEAERLRAAIGLDGLGAGERIQEMEGS